MTRAPQNPVGPVGPAPIFRDLAGPTRHGACRASRAGEKAEPAALARPARHGDKDVGPHNPLMRNAGPTGPTGPTRFAAELHRTRGGAPGPRLDVARLFRPDAVAVEPHADLPDLLDAAEERAAVMEFDGGLSRTEAEALALASCPCPEARRVLGERWRANR